MLFLRLSLTIWGLMLQAASTTAPPGSDCLLPQEKSRLLAETKLDNRIKIYDAASTRCQTSVTAALQGQNSQPIGDQLKSWMEILEMSLKDIEGSAGRKEKSRALIRYEIHLRKALGNIQEYRLRTSAEQFDELEAWLTRARQIHKKFVDMLFQR